MLPVDGLLCFFFKSQTSFSIYVSITGDEWPSADETNPKNMGEALKTKDNKLNAYLMGCHAGDIWFRFQTQVRH